jgi:hypothetical protein
MEMLLGDKTESACAGNGTDGNRIRTLQEARDTRTRGDDALDLARMDDDGGRQAASQPASTISPLHSDAEALPSPT